MEPALNAAVPNVIICDNFYADPVQVRQFALAQEFSFHPGDHKGQRTNQRFCFPGVKERLEQLLGVKITNWDKHGYNGVFQFCVAGDQLVYHADHQSYAAVVYLTPDAPPQAGTTLYRSKATGLRTVNPQTALSKGLSLEQAQQRTFAKKLLDPTAWDTVDVIGNVFNRCAIWNAKLIHAASSYFGTNLNDGRLFQMFFFDIETPNESPLAASKGWPQPKAAGYEVNLTPAETPRETARAAGIQPSTLIAPPAKGEQPKPPTQPTPVEAPKLTEIEIPGRKRMGPTPKWMKEAGIDPNKPISAETETDTPITPEELNARAESWCQILLGQPHGQRVTSLRQLKNQNETLHALVKSKLSRDETSVQIEIPMLEPGRHYTHAEIEEIAKGVVKQLIALPHGIRLAELERIKQTNQFLFEFVNEFFPKENPDESGQ